MNMDNKASEYDRAKLGVWDYPVSDKYYNMFWRKGMAWSSYNNMEHAIEKVRSSPNKKEGHALIADASEIR